MLTNSRPEVWPQRPRRRPPKRLPLLWLLSFPIAFFWSSGLRWSCWPVALATRVAEQGGQLVADSRHQLHQQDPLTKSTESLREIIDSKSQSNNSSEMNEHKPTFMETNASTSSDNKSQETLAELNEETKLELPLYMRIVATLACLVIFTVGVSGNFLVPLVVIKTKYLRNSTNLFLINLSMADLLLLIVSMPTILIELHSRPETWLLGEPMCKVSNYVEMLAANGSIFTILAIGFERYYAICKPLKAGYKCTRFRATIIIFIIWFLSLILTSPILMMAKSNETTYLDGSLVYNCILETDTYWKKSYVFVSMFAFFCLPLLVLMLVYWLISRRLIRENLALSATTSSATAATSLATTSCEVSTSDSIKSKSVVSFQQHRKLKASSSLISSAISIKRRMGLHKASSLRIFMRPSGGTSATNESDSNLSTSGELDDETGRRRSGRPAAQSGSFSARARLSHFRREMASAGAKAFSFEEAPEKLSSSRAAPFEGKLGEGDCLEGAPFYTPDGELDGRQSNWSSGFHEEEEEKEGQELGLEQKEEARENQVELPYQEELEGRRRRQWNCLELVRSKFASAFIKRLFAEGKTGYSLRRGGLAENDENDDAYDDNCQDYPHPDQATHIHGRRNLETSSTSGPNRQRPSVTSSSRLLIMNSMDGQQEAHPHSHSRAQAPPRSSSARTRLNLKQTNQYSVAGSGKQALKNSEIDYLKEPASSNSSGLAKLVEQAATSSRHKVRPSSSSRKNRLRRRERELSRVGGAEQLEVARKATQMTGSQAASADKQQKCKFYCPKGYSPSSNASDDTITPPRKPLEQNSALGLQPLGGNCFAIPFRAPSHSQTSSRPQNSYDITPSTGSLSADKQSPSPLPSPSPTAKYREPRKWSRQEDRQIVQLTNKPDMSSPSSPQERKGSQNSPDDLSRALTFTATSSISPDSSGITFSAFSSKSSSPDSVRVVERSQECQEETAREAQLKYSSQRLANKVLIPSNDLKHHRMQVNAKTSGLFGDKSDGINIDRINNLDGLDAKDALLVLEEEQQQQQNENASEPSELGQQESNYVNDYLPDRQARLKELILHKGNDSSNPREKISFYKHFRFTRIHNGKLNSKSNLRSGSQPTVSILTNNHANGHQQLSELLVVQDLSKKFQMDSRRQVVVMLAFVVACFFLLYLPYRVFTLWLILSTEDQVRSLGMETYYNLTYFSRILIYLHSAINPIAYNLISTKFRKAFTSVLLCRGQASRRKFVPEHRVFLNRQYESNNSRKVSKDELEKRRSLRQAEFQLVRTLENSTTYSKVTVK